MNIQGTNLGAANYTTPQMGGERILNDWVNDPANANNRKNCETAVQLILNCNKVNRKILIINQVSLNLSNLNLTNLADLSSVLRSDIDELNLSGNSLTNIRSATFAEFSNLKVLDLRWIKLDNIPEDVFSGFKGNCNVHINTGVSISGKTIYEWLTNRPAGSGFTFTVHSRSV